MVRMDNRTLKCKMDFEGNIYPSNYGDFRVLEFINKTHVLIEFVATSYQKVTTLNQVRSGEVKDPYYPSICGVGYVGEGVYPITYLRGGKRKSTPAYEVWRTKLRNCYGETKFRRLYKNVKFHKEWLNFQNFAKWFYEQVKLYGKGGVVDKDLLFLGNREYSPTTCVYIPQIVNSLFGGTPTNISGVTFNKLKKAWEVQIHNGKTNKSGERYQSYLGTYPDIETATKVYRSAKISYVRNIALLYQERIPAALFYKLYLGAENYVDYYMYQKEYEIEDN